jgi:nucleotide sugar dehydrogenase
MKKIVICGIGRLGLPLALNFARFQDGEVIGFDVNEDYIKSLSEGNFLSDEPDVNDLLVNSNLKFTSKPNDLADADFIVVCVRTDSLDSGAYDLQQLWQLIETLIFVLRSNKPMPFIRALAINCNVNPGTSRTIAKMLEPFGVEVYFWPEWVKQGSVVYDQTHPEVTILGGFPEYQTISLVRDTISKLNISGNNSKVRDLKLIDAEIAKISLNCFLTVKISFANMIATLLDEVGIDAPSILAAIADDSRIGPKFFQPGFGYGGPCLPRDNAALINFASNFGIELPLCVAADKVNTQRRETLLKSAVRSFHQNGVVPKIESLSYKKGVPIYTESQQLKHASGLADIGIPSTVPDSRDVVAGRFLIDRGNYLIGKSHE